ncbi:nucleotide exchange factor GrpE [Candidatus Vidania fulgoroideorum]
MKKEKIKKIKKENIYLRNRCNNIILEFESMKRRFELENDNIKKYSCFLIIKNFIPVLDGLEITYKNCKDKLTKEGINIILKILKTILLNNNVKKISPKKFDPFNPTLHQAIIKVKTSDKKKNLIFNILQKGYLISNKILRPALVSVTS